MSSSPTKIEWADTTWNPTTGCDRISPGCRECYAATLARRLKAMGQPKYQHDGDPRTSGPGFALTVHPDTLGDPLTWRQPKRVFVNSMSDLFHQDVPDQFIAEVFAVMALAPQHTCQVLTKRPQRMADWLNRVQRTEAWWTLDGQKASKGGVHIGDENTTWPLPNVWLGVSIENDRYTWRADHLRRTPAAVRFISAEPLLGPLPSLDLGGIDWLIVGGESGPNARPMHPDWVRDLRGRILDRRRMLCDHRGEAQRHTWEPGEWCPPDRAGCTAYRGAAFLFKQWGSWAPVNDGAVPDKDVHRAILLDDDGTIAPAISATIDDPGQLMLPVGKKAAGRELDGRTWDEFPTGAAR